MASKPRQLNGTQLPNSDRDSQYLSFEKDEAELIFRANLPPTPAAPQGANSISATRRNRADVSTEPEAPAQRDPHAVPRSVSWRYEQVGRKFYLDGEVAIIDRGRLLQTPAESKEIIRDMLDMQRQRGAVAVVVAGSQRFRREAWLQATVAGLEVKGYRPTEREAQLSDIVRPSAQPQVAKEASTVQPLGDTGARGLAPAVQEAVLEEPPHQKLDLPLQSGRLIEHGEAHYDFDPRHPLSYFVKLETPAGEVTQWGADLARAMRQSLSGARVGDEVVVRHLGKRPVTETRPVHGERGEVVRKEEVKAWVNQWSVESADFLHDRARMADLVRDRSVDSAIALRERPELKGTYEELDIAKKMAPRFYADAQDQQRFVNRLRVSLADEIQRGEPLSASRPRNPRRETTPDDRQPRRPVQERVLS